MARLSTDNLTFDTPAYDSNYAKSIKAIDILGPGTLFIVDIEGTSVSYPFAAFVAAGGGYTCFPYRLEARIKQIVGDGAGAIGDGATGTDIALANLRVLH
jgi:hypothetical protein